MPRSTSATPARGPGLGATVRERWDILLVIAAGGALGSLARWALAEAIPHARGGIPIATWTANLTGAFILGALLVLVTEVWPPHRHLRPFLAVGVLGGFTTFSTYMLDAHTLLGAGAPGRLTAYVLGTLVTGLIACWGGIVLTRGIVSARRNRLRRSHIPPEES
ncbi:MAG: fluoride efflux transporter CrcB [Dermatophilaceae bacterium]